MKIRYTIHGVNIDQATVDATVAGREVRATVPALTIEAVSADGSMGHTFRVTDYSEEDAADMVEGATLIVSLDVE